MSKEVDVQVGVKEAAAKLLNGDAVVVEYTKFAWPVEVEPPLVRGIDYPDWLSEEAAANAQRVDVKDDGWGDLPLPEWLTDGSLAVAEPEVVAIKNDDLPEWLQLDEDCQNEADCQEFGDNLVKVFEFLDTYRLNAFEELPLKPVPERTVVQDEKPTEGRRENDQSAHIGCFPVERPKPANATRKPSAASPPRVVGNPNYPVVGNGTGRRVNLATGQLEHPYEAITDYNEAGRLSPNIKRAVHWVRQNLTESVRPTGQCTADRGWVRSAYD